MGPLPCYVGSVQPNISRGRPFFKSLLQKGQTPEDPQGLVIAALAGGCARADSRIAVEGRTGGRKRGRGKAVAKTRSYPAGLGWQTKAGRGGILDAQHRTIGAAGGSAMRMAGALTKSGIYLSKHAPEAISSEAQGRLARFTYYGSHGHSISLAWHVFASSLGLATAGPVAGGLGARTWYRAGGALTMLSALLGMARSSVTRMARRDVVAVTVAASDAAA